MSVIEICLVINLSSQLLKFHQIKILLFILNINYFYRLQYFISLYVCGEVHFENICIWIFIYLSMIVYYLNLQFLCVLMTIKQTVLCFYDILSLKRFLKIFCNHGYSKST